MTDSSTSQAAKYWAGVFSQAHDLFATWSVILLNEEGGEPRGLPVLQAFLRHAQGVIQAPSQQWAIRLNIQRFSCILLTTFLIEISSMAIYEWAEKNITAAMLDPVRLPMTQDPAHNQPSGLHSTLLLDPG